MSNINEKTKYDHKSIEKKWAKVWVEKEVYAAEDFSKKPKKYILAEFPYPSGKSLHVGHMMRYTLPDIFSRKLRMSGYNVLFPMGWDAFGLPAENNAIKTGRHPSEVIKEASDGYRRVLSEAGYSFDLTREVNTTDPNYYKWTQWLFLKFFENGLAELKEEPVWWSEELKSVLANEEVTQKADGKMYPFERGVLPIERRMLQQWVLKIPQYADKLIAGLDKTDFPEYIRSAQINWIGRSEGAEVDFAIAESNVIATPDSVRGKQSRQSQDKIRVFTTRLDTIFGATFIVLAPEHHLVAELTTSENTEAVQAYIEETKQKSEIDRLSEGKTKTGAFTGSYAINPFTGKQVPIWISDFVLTTYGTGAIMGVPAHDERDFEFAKKFDLEIIQVVKGENENVELPFVTKEGKLMNSGEYDGMDFKAAFNKMVEKAEKEGFGEKKVHYKLRDWLFSRQRYWGEPIPLIHKEDGTVEAIVDTNNPEEVKKNLPLVLPDVPDYTPSSDGYSPLAKNTEWVNTTAKDGTPAKRETNTMPNWAGSCWYYLRYLDPKNDEAFADMEKMKYWLPVDMYFGGSEHTTLHLLYSRFWHKFFYDQGLVPTEEPYQWRMNGGILLGPDGEKMSKSKGNVLNPDEKFEVYGADALRLYISFMGPYDGTIAWQEGGLKACRRLVDEVIDLRAKVTSQSDVIPAKAGIHSTPINTNQDITTAYHKMIKNVTEMADNLKMNTAVSEFMIFINLTKQQEKIDKEMWKGFLKLLAPFAPFITEELWQEINGYTEFKKENSIHLQEWPKYDENLIKESKVVVGVQINGKLRGEVEVNIEETEATVKDRVMALPEIIKWLPEGQTEIKKFIYIPGKIVNIVS
jgi:leucyl-tRNA synthetase